MSQADPIGVKGILELLMVILADTHNKQSEIINNQSQLIKRNEVWIAQNREVIERHDKEIIDLKAEIDGVVQSTNDDATRLLNDLKTFAHAVGFLQNNPNFFNPRPTG
jgi:hypothetical protein